MRQLYRLEQLWQAGKIMDLSCEAVLS